MLLPAGNCVRTLDFESYLEHGSPVTSRLQHISGMNGGGWCEVDKERWRMTAEFGLRKFQVCCDRDVSLCLSSAIKSRLPHHPQGALGQFSTPARHKVLYSASISVLRYS